VTSRSYGGEHEGDCLLGYYAGLSGFVEIGLHFRDDYCLCYYLPDAGGSKHLRNVFRFLRDYWAQQPIRQSSSISTLFIPVQYKV
jgi:hypothetical protein